MSIQATAHVIKWAKCSPTDFVILLMIADSANSDYDHEFWMTAKNLAVKARVSQRTATSALKRFVANGWLEEVQATMVDGKRTGRQGRYRFLYPKSGEPVYDPQPRSGDRNHVPRGIGTTATGDMHGVPIRSQDDPKDEQEKPGSPAATGAPEPEIDTESEPYRLCVFFNEQRQIAFPESTLKPIVASWIKHAEFLLRHHDKQTIAKVIRWLFSVDGEWTSPNVQGVPKFRQRFDSLHEHQIVHERKTARPVANQRRATTAATTTTIDFRDYSDPDDPEPPQWDSKGDDSVWEAWHQRWLKRMTPIWAAEDAQLAKQNGATQ